MEIKSGIAAITIFKEAIITTTILNELKIWLSIAKIVTENSIYFKFKMAFRTRKPNQSTKFILNIHHE